MLSIQMYDRNVVVHKETMPDIDVNAMIWRIFLSATMKAAVHLGQDYQENLRTTKNIDFEKAQQLFDISHKLILNQSEIFGIMHFHG